MTERNDRPSRALSRLDPRPVSWMKVSIVLILVAGAVAMRTIGAIGEAGTLLGLAAISLGVNGLRKDR